MSTARPTYRALIAVPGFRRLAAATFVARTGVTMQSLVVVLFVLQSYHSPALAGIVVFTSLVPGLVVSPVAGALLDRHRRTMLITADYALAAVVLTLIVALKTAGALPAPVLLVVAGIGSLTSPLSNSGTRSLFPVLVPRSLWDRANAVDSGGYVIAAIIGPALAGIVVGVAGARVAMLATAALFILAMLLVVRMSEPFVARAATRSLTADALAGLGYVVRHRELRGLAVTVAVSNVAFGILTVGMPVLVLNRLGAGSGTVGLMYAVLGVAGLVSATLAGRVSSERREAWFVATGCLISAVSMLAVILAASGGGLLVLAVGMALFGIANGPLDIGLFSLRQRVTPTSWMGRAFAVSMSLNFVGMPVGSAVGGPIVEHSIPAAFALAVAVDLAAVVAAVLMLRPRPAATRLDGDSELVGERAHAAQASRLTAD